MSNKYPIEPLLRPPVEFYPAAASILSAATLVAFPKAFIMNPLMAYTAASAFSLHASFRAWQGFNIVRYHRNLKRLKRYSLTADEIPYSHEKLFLGMGFKWDQRHTQRLRDVRLPQNRKYHEPSKAYFMARKLENKLEKMLLDQERRAFRRSAKQIRSLLQREVWWNPVAPLPPVGGDSAIHGVELDESEIWMNLGERVGHTLVLGTTRVGKTRFAELLITQDIRRGDVVIVFDPKGDEALLRRMYAEAVRAGREKDFYVFHLGHPEISDRYNPVGTFSKITEVATRTANQLPGEGQSAAFKEFVWRFVNVMSRAMMRLGQKPTYEAIYRNAVNIDTLCIQYFENWLDHAKPQWRAEFENHLAQSGSDKQTLEQAKKTGRSLQAIAMVTYIREAQLHDPVGDALISILSNDRTYFEKLVSSLYPLLEKLTTGKVAELISPDYSNLEDTRRIFDWQTVINNGGIVYIGLDALTDAEVAGAVGNSMFSDLTSVAGQIYKHGQSYGLPVKAKPRKISVHADEFNELIGDEFIPLINKAGGAGFQITAYTQTWSDVEARIGSKAKADQIGGNFNTLIMLRVKNTATAEILTDQLPEVDLISTVAASSANDTNDPTDFADFASKNEDRVTYEKAPMLSPADLVQLPKGQAFALIEGGQLYKLRMPLADPSHDPAMPENLETIALAMRKQYETKSPGESWADLWWTRQCWCDPVANDADTTVAA